MSLFGCINIFKAGVDAMCLQPLNFSELTLLLSGLSH